MNDRVFICDLETEGIEQRPLYPPKPVGMALYVPSSKPVYHAWGHPSDNNSTKSKAVGEYRSLVSAGLTPVFHHAGFDLDVLENQLGIRWPAYHHDSLILAFLLDPRSPSFELKKLAERYFGEPPTERDELRDWIQSHVPECKRSKQTWGKYICRAPGELVGRYARGDVTRTYKLYEKCRKEVLKDPLQRTAYQREIKLTRVIINMERRGVPVATQRLKNDIPKFEAAQRKLEGQLLDRLKVAKSRREEFKWSGEGFADQLERSRVVKEWIMTKPSKSHPEGQRRTGTDSLMEVGVEPGLVKELEVRAQLQTCISTFMEPWLAQGRQHGGRFYARFNQVRQPSFGDGRKLVGTETGRLSMTPNLQNVIRSDKDPRVPMVRDYVTPGDKKLCLIQRDYSQQELRILAHYEEGPFLAKYLADPTIDAHTAVGELIEQIIHVALKRRDVKDLNFGLLYGMGQKKLALKLMKPLSETRILYRAHAKALPGVKALKEQLDAAAEAGEPIYTWGGRRYFCEPSRFDEDEQRWWNFAYRLLNLKIQGSAADCTKQAMLNYHEAGYDDKWPLILQVHDELLATAVITQAQRAHQAMMTAMAAVDFKVPMLSDGKMGRISWHRMKKVNF